MLPTRPPVRTGRVLYTVANRTPSTDGKNGTPMISLPARGRGGRSINKHIATLARAFIDLGEWIADAVESMQQSVHTKARLRLQEQTSRVIVDRDRSRSRVFFIMYECTVRHGTAGGLSPYIICTGFRRSNMYTSIEQHVAPGAILILCGQWTWNPRVWMRTSRPWLTMPTSSGRAERSSCTGPVKTFLTYLPSGVRISGKSLNNGGTMAVGPDCIGRNLNSKVDLGTNIHDNM